MTKGKNNGTKNIITMASLVIIIIPTLGTYELRNPHAVERTLAKQFQRNTKGVVYFPPEASWKMRVEPNV